MTMPEPAVPSQVEATEHPEDDTVLVIAEPPVAADPVGETVADPAGETVDDPGGGAEASVDSSSDPVDFRMALVSSVTLDLPSQHPSVVLREIDTPRRQLTFSIGMPDAVALSHAFRRIATPRPLTQELMSDVLQQFDIDVVAVRIVARTGSVYFAELDLRGRNGRSVHSCRPSDALTVALHQPVQVPILIDVRLLEGSGDVEPAGTDAR